MTYVSKKRKKPHQLVLWDILKARTDIESTDMQSYLRIEKGYEGECLFDQRLKQLPEQFLILNDLHFITYSQATLQIDSLVITGNDILLFEVKHYEGDFYIENDHWCAFDEQKITNPLHQLKRSESLLSKMLRNEQFPFHVKPYLVFTHPEFTLFHAPRDEPILLPNQLPRFFRYLQHSTKQLHPSAYRLAKHLLSLTKDTSPYQPTNTYDYDDLKKGVFCQTCSSPLAYQTRYFLHCPFCQTTNPVDIAILQAVKELRTLFPEEKITTLKIHDWTGKIVSKPRIRQILKNHFIRQGHGKYSYYMEKKITFNKELNTVLSSNIYGVLPEDDDM